jgi:membrane carboxypeptidase/penicillin-binding protein
MRRTTTMPRRMSQMTRMEMSAVRRARTVCKGTSGGEWAWMGLRRSAGKTGTTIE